MRVPLSKLHAAPWNPRKIADARFQNLCRSIEADPGLLDLRPILATKDGTIYAGNMRFRAVQHLGWQDVPAELTDIPERVAKERALIDNGQWGEWQDDDLGNLLAELKDAGSEVDVLGFEPKDIDRLIRGVNPLVEDEDIDLEPPAEPITKPGDLWLLGEHRLLCGDATNADDVVRLMDGCKADMVFTDPPYGMRLDTDYTHLPESAIRSKTYDQVVGDDQDFDPRPLLRSLADVAEQFWWGGDWYYDRLPSGGSWIIWDKRNEASDGLVGNHFEVCWSRQHHRREMKRYHWAGFTARDRDEARTHPTQKPVELVANMVGSVGVRGDIVLDLFAGAGTTMIAAEQLGRRCYAMEIEPAYCDVSVHRWERLTGKTAVLESVSKNSQLRAPLQAV